MGTVSFTAEDNLTADALRERARTALLERMGPAHDFGDNVEYQIYRDGYNGGTVNGTVEDRERLGISGTGTIESWSGTNSARRFTANIRPTSEYPTVRGMVVGASGNPLTQVAGDDASHPWVLPSDVQAGLRRLDFRSDGATGRSREESLRYVREFERIFRGRTFRFGTPPRDVSGEDLMRRVINEGRANMGPTEGTDTISAIYTEAGLDSSASGSRTDADFARSLGEPPVGTAPNGTTDSDPSITDFITQPTLENARRLRLDNERTDELLRVLMAAMANGNPDVLKAALQLVARQGRNNVAMLAMSTINQLQNLDSQIAEINRQVQALDLGSTDASTRARASSEFARFQTQLNTLNSLRQSVIQNLESQMKVLEEINQTTTVASRSWDQANQAGWMRS